MPTSIQPGDCDCCTGAADPSSLDQRTADLIERFGWAIVGVTDPHAPFAYTVGLSAKNLPELYIEVAIPKMIDKAQMHLNAAACLAVEGTDLTAGFILPGATTWQAEPLTDHKPLVMARRRYGRISALRLMRP